ncbi:MAG: oligosaccharide flippase family protein [Gemmatimonadales bacterium]
MARQGRGRLGREALIYMIGMFLGRAASLIMLPVYTRLLAPADYGLLQILDMTSDAVAILVSAGCIAGVMRFYFKADARRDRRAVLGSAIALQIGLNLFGTLLLVLFADPIWQHVLHGAQSRSLVYLAAANFTLGSVSTVPLILMQIEKRAFLFSAVSVARLVIQLSGNILFLVVLHWGPGGILLSSLIANVVIGGGTATWMLRRTGFVVSRKALLDLRRFGLPYQLATLGTFIVTFGDRLFLDKFGGLAAVGLYGLAYQFGFLLEQVGIGPFVRAWTPRRFEYIREATADRDAKNQQGFLYLNVIAFSCAAGIAVFVHPVLRVLADRDFWSSANLVPVILAAYIVQGWVSVIELGIDISEKTKYASYGVWASVVAVLVFYSLLIPRFGGIGAAWATLLGFLVRFFFHWRFSQRLCPLAYGWLPVLRLASYAVAVTLVSIYLRPAGVISEFAVGFGALALFALAVWTTILRQEDRNAVLGFVADRKQAIVTRLAVA